MPDATAQKFDSWALNGKAEDMQRGHYKSVSAMLRSARFGGEFTFLDIGCGNGWVVRLVASRHPGCRLSVGIDKSANMISRAESDPGNTGRERYLCADIEEWRYSGRRFDYVFAMESIYYADSVGAALAKIYRLLRPGGVFLCGTDFYAENTPTKRWAAAMGITMHLHSEGEWKDMLARAGFEVRTRRLKDPAAKDAWKRNVGTLFLRGRKPAG